MGRPIYNYELTDPDFSWLVNSYKENNPNSALVDSSGVPVSFIKADKTLEIKEMPEATNEEFDNQLDEKLAQKEAESAGENK